jgi:oligosaccharide repeat unit polymerase
MLFYLVYDHVGLAFIYSHKTIERLNGVAVNREVLLLLALYTNILVLAYIITGCLNANLRCKIRDIHIHTIQNVNIRWFAILLLFIVTTFFAYIKFSSNSPLQLLLAGKAAAAGAARVAQVSHNATAILGIKHSYVNILFVILNFVGILFLIKYMASKKNKYLVMYFIYIAIAGLFSFSNVSKGFMVTILLQLWFVYSAVYHKGMVLNRFVIVPFFAASVAIAVFSAWFMGNETIDFLYPLKRLIMGNLYPQYVMVDHFNFNNLLYGTSAPSWFSLGLHEQVNTEILAWKLIFPDSPKDIFYTAPSSFVSEAHANFHFIGVIVIAFLVFGALRLIDHLITRIHSPLIFLTMLIFLSLYFSSLSVSGAINLTVDYYLWGVLLFVFFAYKVTLLASKSPCPTYEGGLKNTELKHFS